MSCCICMEPYGKEKGAVIICTNNHHMCQHCIEPYFDSCAKKIYAECSVNEETDFIGNKHLTITVTKKNLYYEGQRISISCPICCGKWQTEPDKELCLPIIPGKVIQTDESDKYRLEEIKANITAKQSELENLRKDTEILQRTIQEFQEKIKKLHEETETIEKNKKFIKLEMLRQARKEVYEEMEEIITRVRELENECNKELTERRKNFEEEIKCNQEQVNARIKLNFSITNEEIKRKKEDFEKGLEEFKKSLEIKAERKFENKHKDKIQRLTEEFELQKEQYEVNFRKYLKDMNAKMYDFEMFFSFLELSRSKITRRNEWFHLVEVEIEHFSKNELYFCYFLDLYLKIANPRFNLEDYMKFRNEQKIAKKNKNKWIDYTVKGWIKRNIK